MAGGVEGRDEYRMLARVRRAMRAVNAAILRGSEGVGVTVQEQAVLLALAAYGGTGVPLADVRTELEMDQASASILLARLVRAHLVERAAGHDRRAVEISLTRRGWSTFQRSVDTIRDEMQWSEQRGEIAALRDELKAYLTFYLRGKAKGRRRTSNPARTVQRRKPPQPRR